MTRTPPHLKEKQRKKRRKKKPLRGDSYDGTKASDFLSISVPTSLSASHGGEKALGGGGGGAGGVGGGGWREMEVPAPAAVQRGEQMLGSWHLADAESSRRLITALNCELSSCVSPCHVRLQEVEAPRSGGGTGGGVAEEDLHILYVQFSSSSYCFLLLFSKKGGGGRGLCLLCLYEMCHLNQV